MDRLEKIKGYLDRLPKDDAKWLVREVESLRGAVETAAKVAEQESRRAELAEAELDEVKGEAPKRRCPCGHPDDHAGWCPRQGGEYTR